MTISSWNRRSATVQPAPTAETFANPMKGLQGRQRMSPRHPYLTTVRWYVRWSELESRGSDGIDRIREYSDRQWAGLAARNIKAVPRVFLEFPSIGRSYWPEDLERGEFHTPAFAGRLVALIAKLGAVWNDDPRVAWIESGLIGAWGEQHSPSPDDELQRIMGDALDAAFPDKLITRRYPGEFTRRGWGLYWDSFGCTCGRDAVTSDALSKEPDMYRSAPVHGEISYDFCSPAGRTPYATVSDPHNAATLAGLVRMFHASALSWVSDAVHGPATAAGMDLLQQTLGYRFIVERCSFPRRVRSGSPIAIELSVRNVGSAPFHYRWPLEISLLDPSTGEVRWAQTVEDVDIRAWQPGDGWDSTTSSYLVPSPIVTSDIVVGPVPDGVHELAIAVVDPAARQPALRFAIRNYRSGGRHPIGLVAVGTRPEEVPSDPALLRPFDSLRRDRTLSYSTGLDPSVLAI